MDHNILYIEQTDSTNREMWRMIDAGRELPEGFALRAGDQTDGRGLGNTSWISEAHKNLTFSVLFKPHFLPPNKQFLLNKTIAVALITALSKTANNISFKIKWPNDIYCNNKKIAGTLIENRIMGQTFELCVVGAGVNVNQRIFPDDLPNPTSLALMTEKEHSIKRILDMILESMILNYSILKQKKYESAIHEAYLKHLLGYGKRMQFASEGEVFYAMIVGVNDYGKLILQFENQDIKEFAMKEIELVL